MHVRLTKLFSQVFHSPHPSLSFFHPAIYASILSLGKHLSPICQAVCQVQWASQTRLICINTWSHRLAHEANGFMWSLLLSVLKQLYIRSLHERPQKWVKLQKSVTLPVPHSLGRGMGRKAFRAKIFLILRRHLCSHLGWCNLMYQQVLEISVKYKLFLNRCYGTYSWELSERVCQRKNHMLNTHHENLLQVATSYSLCFLTQRHHSNST